MQVEVGDGLAAGFLPSAYRFLDTTRIPPRGDKLLRPALGVYNVSLARLIGTMEEAFALLVKLVEDNRIPAGKDGLSWLDPTLDLWTRLLMSADSHVDDVRTIVFGVLGGKNAWKSRPGKAFTARVKPYKDRVSNIANHIKHGQGRLSPFAFYSSSRSFLGYVVEGVTSEGTLGPEPTIHAGGHGACSFARDCRLHFVWLYGVSDALARVLEDSGREERLEVPEIHTESQLIELARSIARVPPLMYPDECFKAVPRIELKDDEVRRLVLSYRDDASAQRIPREANRIMTGWKGDGVTRSFRFPYKPRRSKADSSERT